MGRPELSGLDSDDLDVISPMNNDQNQILYVQVSVEGAPQDIINSVTRLKLNKDENEWFVLFHTHKEREKPITVSLKWQRGADKGNMTQITGTSDLVHSFQRNVKRQKMKF